MQILLALGLLLSQPQAIDGDTLRDAQGERYRVENIDAPERGSRSECREERLLAEAASAYVGSPKPTAWMLTPPAGATATAVWSPALRSTASI